MIYGNFRIVKPEDDELLKAIKNNDINSVKSLI